MEGRRPAGRRPGQARRIRPIGARRRGSVPGGNRPPYSRTSITTRPRIRPATNAITGADVAEARRVAALAERHVRSGEPLGLLHGLPTGIKDLHETGGLLTTYGSPLFLSLIHI